MKKELEELVNDFGGGREKRTEKSQLFYDLTHSILHKLNGQPYIQVELFIDYLKEVTKRNACVNIFGREV